MIKIKLLLSVILLGFVLVGCGTPKNIVCSWDSPVSVKNGERFEITVTVKNTDEKQQKLVSLDVGQEYLEGIIIEKSMPPFFESSRIPIDNTISYSYNITIEPDEEQTIVLSAYAAKSGDFSSEVDFCINSEISFLSHSIRTIIED